MIGAPAAAMTRDLVGSLLERKGLSVVRTAGASEHPVLIGRLHLLRTQHRSRAAIGRVECEIRLALMLESRGKLAAQKTFEVKHAVHAGELEPAVFARATDEALAKLLVEIAAFADSEKFRVAVRPPPVKA